jgi:hypothetical protein
MSQFSAVTWKVRAGTEQTVAELFRKSGRPEHDIRGPDGSVKGRLLQTVVLMKENTVVRVIEFDGELSDVHQHMRRQQEVQELERELDKYLETPRDMSTPEGAQKYFRETTMQVIVHRRHDDPEVTGQR